MFRKIMFSLYFLVLFSSSALCQEAPKASGELVQAVKANDPALVKKILLEGAVVDYDTVKLARDNSFTEIDKLLTAPAFKIYMARAQAELGKVTSASAYSKVVKELKIAKEIDPQQASIYYNIGVLQEKTGQYEDAIENLKKYLELSPGSSDTEVINGMIARLQGKIDDVDKSTVSKNAPDKIRPQLNMLIRKVKEHQSSVGNDK